MLASEKYLDYLQKNHKEAGQVKLLVSSDVKALRSSSVLSVRDLGLTPSLVGKVSDVTLTKKKHSESHRREWRNKDHAQSSESIVLQPAAFKQPSPHYPSDISLCIWIQSSSSNDMC